MDLLEIFVNKKREPTKWESYSVASHRMFSLQKTLSGAKNMVWATYVRRSTRWTYNKEISPFTYLSDSSGINKTCSDLL